MTESFAPAGLLKRLAAMFYDSLLLLGVWFIASAVALAGNHGEPLRGLHPLFTLYLLAVTICFFGWFWRHGGQTLGMRAWKLRLENELPGNITWLQVVLRCLAAIPSLALGGLGYWWMLWSPDKHTWHDRFSHTRMVDISRRSPSDPA